MSLSVMRIVSQRGLLSMRTAGRSVAVVVRFQVRMPVIV